jgi:chromosome partitioning protein
MQAISIVNQKGGVGKTTLSSLLAFYLSDKMGARVLAVDLDGQRNLSHTLKNFRSEVATTALFEEAAVVLPAVEAGICLIHGTPQLANLERATAEEAHRRVRLFAAHLAALKDRFDYCLIDPPPTLGIRMIAALASADFVAMPIELEEYSTHAVKDMLQAVFGVRQQWNPKLKFLGIIANRFMHNSARQKEALRELLQNYQQYVLPLKISTRSAIPKALEQGCGVWRLPASTAKDASVEVLHAFGTLMEGMRKAGHAGAAAS